MNRRIACPPVELARSYAACRTLARRHGTTYYWSTMLLPARVRPHVHALYAFCRHADDIVDDLGAVSSEERSRALQSFGDRFFRDLDRGYSDHPVLRAVVHTVGSCDVEPELFARFLRSMTMDLTVATYETWDDLRVYMDGSAAVIGEMMLPILRPPHRGRARQHARDLGDAFQLTNFLRDIGEDLDRGRQYIPQEDARRFGVDLAQRRVDDGFIALMRFEIDRCRALYASADRGIALLPQRAARCVGAARVLYSSILDQIEAQRFDVFSRRARVSTTRKAAHVAGAMVRRPTGLMRTVS